MRIREGVWKWMLQSYPISILEEKLAKAKEEKRYLAIFDHNKDEQDYFEKGLEKKKQEEKENYHPVTQLI